jgi:hypothetical protein
MRLISTSTGFFGLGGLAALAVVLPVWSSGCGHTACFVFTQGEYAAHNACPAPKDALASFTDPHCPGPVVSVDGEGIFNLNDVNPDQSLCCYPVTQQAIDHDDISGVCQGPSFGGGGFGGGGFGGIDVGGFGEVSSVGGGAGGPCFNNCNMVLNGANPSQLCPDQSSAEAWAALASCACTSGNPCFKVCQLNVCSNALVSKECLSCLEGPTSGCASAVAMCQSD